MQSISLLAKKLIAKRKPKLEHIRRPTMAPWMGTKRLTDGRYTLHPLVLASQLPGLSQGLQCKSCHASATNGIFLLFRSSWWLMESWQNSSAQSLLFTTLNSFKLADLMLSVLWLILPIRFLQPVWRRSHLPWCRRCKSCTFKTSSNSLHHTRMKTQPLIEKVIRYKALLEFNSN